jgi:hypothetical protein
MSNIKNCPRCGLLHFAAAPVCDCGYRFPATNDAGNVVQTGAIRICPICAQQTDSLKQYSLIHTLVAIPFVCVEATSAVYRACPPCMRTLVWKRCWINGLTTWIVGYLVLIPYTLGLTLATFRRGHSWAVVRGITPKMQVDQSWVNRPSVFEKILAICSVPLCFLPVIGLLFCLWVHWKTRRRSGWVHRTAEPAAAFAPRRCYTPP